MKTALLLLLALIAPTAHASSTRSINADTITNTTGGSGLSVPSTGSAVCSDSASQTLTNKTLSGSSNTLSNIANASLVNSSITVNGTSCSLGGSCSPSASVAFNQDLFFCSGNTGFTLTASPTAASAVLAHQDGQLLIQGASYDYTVSGTTVTFTTACPTGAQVLIVYTH